MDDVIDLTHPSHIDAEHTGITIRKCNDYYVVRAFFKYRDTEAELRVEDVITLRDYLNKQYPPQDRGNSIGKES